MCGLIGEFNNDKTFLLRKRECFIKQALLCDVVRGVDSTGIFAVGRDDPKEVFSYKKAVAGYDFIQLNQYRKFEDTLRHYRFVVGHNRWATKGGVSDSTAHPFTKGNITLVHNGTLKNWYNLETEHKYTVDSEAIAASIHENGAEFTIKNLDGAYALVWYDSDTEKMYMIRNDERTLYYATSKKTDTLIFASEHGMLSWLGNRNEYNINTVETIEPGVLYEFDDKFNSGGIKQTVMDTYVAPPKKKGTGSSKQAWLEHDKWKNSGLKNHGLKHGEWVDMEVLTYDLYTPQSVRGYYTCSPIDNSNFIFKIHGQEADHFLFGDVLTGEIVSFIDARRTDGDLDEILIGTPMETGMTRKEYDIWDKEQEALDAAHTKSLLEAANDTPEEYVQGPGAKLITVQEFARLTKHGCAQCTSDIDLEDDESITWTFNDDPICQDCTEANLESGIMIQKH